MIFKSIVSEDMPSVALKQGLETKNSYGQKTKQKKTKHVN